MSTKQTLRTLRDALETALGDARPGGALADTFERFDGEPADAIDEHVADLRGDAGASVLVGFLSDDVAEADEGGVALASTLRPSVAVVRRRSQKGSGLGVASATADAEALDDLYDEAASAIEAAGFDVRRGRALAGDTRDWFGRILVAERSRPFPA